MVESVCTYRYHLKDQPYFCIRKVGERWETRGIPTCALGHRLERPGGGMPDGIFAAWHWDGHQLHVQNDRYGIYPLYYFLGPEEISISPSLVRLLAEGASAELDSAALAVFLRLGFFLGEDTPFTSIRALPPAVSFQWTAGRLTFASEQPPLKPQHISRDAAIEGYSTLFRQAIQRRLSEAACVLPLSGGRDSRHILLELCATGHKPGCCVTLRHFPPRTNEDAKVAAELARTFDIPHTILDQTGSRYQAEVRKNLWTNFCADEHAQFLPLADTLQKRACVLYDGVGGDVLSAGLRADEQEIEFAETGRFAEWAEAILNTRSNETPGESDLARLLPTPVYRRFSRDCARARVLEELNRYRETPNPGSQFYFWNRTRREVALVPYSLLEPTATVFSPYLDHDLYDFLASLPAEAILDCKLHTETIARAYPQYAAIPYEDKSHGHDWTAQRSKRYFRRWTAETMRSLWQRPSHFLHKSALFPKLARSLITGGGFLVWNGPMLLYLLQLESVCTQAGAQATLEEDSSALRAVGTSSFDVE
jgi:asparagine synthetase B (glutamine-hydrolysing)